ncbi:MAG: efflux RND transporter periplasmic adaptor subunit [Alphaproteobacteria bacterium]|nr:efflux RND transporter periplasmic adaptor subunit [Alphaproteobacteria bacterium]
MKRRSSLNLLVVAVLAVVFAGGGYLYWKKQQSGLPDYIVSGNGRIEAEETHVAAKYAGRVIDVVPEEGDMVKEGDVIAHIDVEDLKAQRNGAQASLAAANNAVAQAQAEIVHLQAQLELAQADAKRAEALVGKGVSQELYDQRKAAVKTAAAALAVGEAGLKAARNQVETAQAEIDRLNVLINDSVLKAPLSGRVQYRLAEPGEVLSAGSRVVTILDLENVYMTIFLSTKDIGQIHIGSEARIVLDALPDLVIPAQVSFISSEAQFTPREVETRDEREKLMFRVKIRIPKALLAAHIEKVRTGLPGMGYVILGEGHEWPETLKDNIPPVSK